MPDWDIIKWLKFIMAVVTVLPFLGVFIRPLAHSWRYATFMSSWSASTVVWVFWLRENINTFEYFLYLAVTIMFPIIWFYRTRIRSNTRK